MRGRYKIHGVSRPNTLDDVYDEAVNLYRKPYVWGANGPDAYDCSGLVIHLMRMVGMAPNRDMTAQMLYDYYWPMSEEGVRGRGALAFFGQKDNVVHVGWMIDNKLMVSAAGGGRNLRNKTDAEKMNAFVKFQPVDYYRFPPIYKILMPWYYQKGVTP